MPTDPNRLLGSLSRTLRIIDFAADGLERRLDELVEVAAAICDVAGAGLMLVDERSRMRLVGSSSEAAHALEAAQQHAGEGPKIEAKRRRELVAVNDLSREARWAAINRAVAPFGVVSVLSAPICVGGDAVGNLHLFDRVARDWTQAERAGLAAFAGVAAALLRIALEAHRGGRLVAELSDRLSSRRLGSEIR